MKRTVIWTLVAVVVVGTLAVLGFLRNFEQVPFTRRIAEQPEARRNPFLALERSLGELGRPLARIRSPAALDHLPPGGVLILDANRRRGVDAARAARLLDWAAAGGYLIVVGEPFEGGAGNDPLLARLGVSRPPPAQPPRCEPDDLIPPEHLPLRKLESIAVTLPGQADPYRVGWPRGNLAASDPKPAWRAGLSPKRSAILHFAHGHGQITVLDSLHPFNNRNLGRHDHADFLWALISTYQPAGRIHLASRLEFPTLREWLLESAAPALFATGLLILLWLWRIVPRFGGTRALPPPGRRALVQHLAAIGRSVWREGGLGCWLDAVRQSVQQRIGARRPDLRQLTPAEQAVALGELAGSPPSEVAAALSDRPAPTPDAFTQRMRTLQAIDQHLQSPR